MARCNKCRSELARDAPRGRRSISRALKAYRHALGCLTGTIYRAGDLGDFDGRPNRGLWILEIQIAHPTKPYGAFYEDLLA